MKKCYIVICLLVSMCVLFISGCENGEMSDSIITETQKVPVQQENILSENETDHDGNGESESETVEEGGIEATNSLRNVTIYYVDELSAAVVGKSVDVVSEFDIWNVLVDSGTLTEECKLISIKLNDDKTMDLNFNHATAERINSMGSTGETEIIGCIVNTYLEAYGCTGIRLLEEGNDFVSSHGAEFSEYPGRIEFK